MIQCWSSHAFAGKVNRQEKVAPACSKMVSPQFALLSAVCKLPPLLTGIVDPGAGVSDIAVWRYVRGNSAGPSNPDDGVGVFGFGAIEIAKLCVAKLFEASVTLAMNENCPVWLVEPVNCPVVLKLKPDGRDPDATDHW
jgi:hypothetical protein